jgi:hypothetical protein
MRNVGFVLRGRWLYIILNDTAIKRMNFEVAIAKHHRISSKAILKTENEALM